MKTKRSYQKQIGSILTKDFMDAEVKKGKSYLQISLETGISKSTVGYYAKKYGYENRHKNIDMIGKKFGMLTVVKRAPNRMGEKISWWLCRCECGVEKEIRRTHLMIGNTKSCGCHHYKWTPNTWSWKGYGEISGRYWSVVKFCAKKRGLEFFISIEYAWELFLKQDRKCALTGEDLFLARDYTKSNRRQTASLDRINSNLGYIEENIQWVHKDVNGLKSDLEQDYFIELCEKVANHYENKN